MCSPAVCGGVRVAHRISHMCSPAVCGGIRVAHRISHLCCVLVFCFPVSLVPGVASVPG